jgi:hypothetical protein
MRRIFLWISIIGFLNGAPANARAQENIGEVTLVEGAVDIQRGDQEAFVVRKGEPVYLGDRIRTKSYSKAELRLADSSVVKLAPSSCMIVEEFKLDTRGRRDFCRVSLTRGLMEACVAKTSLPETFIINTPNTKGAVRGSDIFISYFAGKTGVFVQEGVLSVANMQFPYLSQRISSGYCAFVPFNEAPMPPRPALEAEIAQYTRDVTPVLIKKWLPSQGAAQMQGVIVSLSGTVRIFRQSDEDWQLAQLNSVVSEKDILQTASDGKAHIRMSNGNSLFLEPDTEVRAVTLRQDASTGNFESTFEVPKGRIRGIVDKMSKESTFQVRTPTVVCGVRGTFLEVRVEPSVDAATPGQTQAFFEGGAGFVSNPLTGETQEVAAGQNVTADARGVISSPMETLSQERSEMVQDMAASLGAGAFSSGDAMADADVVNTLAEAGASTALTQASDIASDTLSRVDNIDLQSTLTFSETHPSATIDSYTAALGNYIMTAPEIQNAGMNLVLNSGNTWSGQISGTMNSNLSSGWDLAFGAPGSDYVRFFDFPTPVSISTGGTLGTPTTFSGDVVGTDPDVTLQLDSFSGTANTSGGFTATASGTWTE